MKITGIEVFTIDFGVLVREGRVKKHPPGPQKFLFVKLTTDEGITGYGETTEMPFRLSSSAILLKELAETLVIGKSPHDMETGFRKVYGLGYRPGRPDRTLMGYWSAIDMACWDIIGKAAGQPIYNLLGGKVHDSVRMYSYVFGNMSSKSAWEESLAKTVGMGFTALKFDPFVGCDAPRGVSMKELKHCDDVMTWTRDFVGDKLDILFGTHGQFTTAEAVRVAKVIEPYKPLWFEEPVPPDNPEGMAIVARSTCIPVAAGERLVTKYEFQQLFSRNAIGVAQLDLGRAGGMLEAKKIAGMAEACHILTAPHVFGGPIIAAASIQLDVCCPNFLIQEGIEDWGGVHADMLLEPMKFEKGYLTPSGKPGLGVNLNEEYIKKLESSD